MASFETKRRCRRLVNDSVFADRKLTGHHWRGHFNHLVGWPRRSLLTGGLRRRLPRDEFPALRRFCPGVEEHKPEAARLAVDLCLDRRTPGDERGVAREAHLAIAAGRVLVLRPSRAQGGKPRRRAAIQLGGGGSLASPAVVSAVETVPN